MRRADSSHAKLPSPARPMRARGGGLFLRLPALAIALVSVLLACVALSAPAASAKPWEPAGVSVLPQQLLISQDGSGIVFLACSGVRPCKVTVTLRATPETRLEWASLPSPPARPRLADVSPREEADAARRPLAYTRAKLRQRKITPVEVHISPAALALLRRTPSPATAKLVLKASWGAKAATVVRLRLLSAAGTLS